MSHCDIPGRDNKPQNSDKKEKKIDIILYGKYD